MKLNMSLATTASAMAMATFANAGFINGGFEDGSFNGWTLEHGNSSSTTNPSGIAFSAGSAGHANVIGSTSDPYSPFDSAFEGSYMARLNEFAPNYDATRISQQVTMLAGETSIFINWGSVMQDSQHVLDDQPLFLIEIYKNGSLFASESHDVSQGAAGGWIASAIDLNSVPTYYSSGTYNISGWAAGDIAKIVMTVVDCGQGAHSGWAYLDDIGTTFQPPVITPDSGTTIAMLGLAFSGLAGLQRKLGIRA
ncbi:MAG: VPDSG-CTERM sorting domain-containing protein [Verrucomicrobiota bacterium]